MQNLRLRAYITLRLTAHRLREAATTQPQPLDWLVAAGLTTALGLVAVPVGLLSHFLTPTLADVSWVESLRLAQLIRGLMHNSHSQHLTLSLIDLAQSMGRSTKP